MIDPKIAKKRILLVFGTRPEAIKMAPLVKEFQLHPDKFETIVCVTAQHREMLDQVLNLFEINPDYDLNLMKQGQDLYDITSKVILGMRDVLSEVKPDLVLVHGDTTTSTASALAAFYQQIPVGHIEAGLRTHNIYSPWPEEMNRQITGRIATYHFSPTETSKSNLLKEGIKESNIFVTGNTVIDALHIVLEQIRTKPKLETTVLSLLSKNGISENLCSSWIDNKRKLVLITGHRRENFGEGFINICKAIKELAEKYPEVDFVYPMHLNPNVRKPISEVFGEISDNSCNLRSNVHFIEPLEYLPFVYLMSKSYLVLTDSGGIQEEAPGLGKPVLVMRDTTERPEALEAGTVILVGTKKDVIFDKVSELIEDTKTYKTMSKANNPYGDGKSCQRIIEKFIN
jgi:UDP-N-acetylglucosamine 2-epimerase (non-hydrolysing)